MSTTISGTEQVGDLISQVTQAADAFKSDNREDDRVVALKAAQGLVRAFQKPQDHVYNLAYSVCFIAMFAQCKANGIAYPRALREDRNRPGCISDAHGQECAHQAGRAGCS